MLQSETVARHDAALLGLSHDRLVSVMLFAERMARMQAAADDLALRRKGEDDDGT